jgi:hypothetical protein
MVAVRRPRLLLVDDDDVMLGLLARMFAGATATSSAVPWTVGRQSISQARCGSTAW